MDMFGKTRKEIRPIDRSDLIMFTQNLRNFVMFYEKFIFINDDETREKINTLKKYLKLLSLERYDCLINDPSIVYDDVSVYGGQQVQQEKMTQEMLDAMLNDPTLPF